MTWKVEDVKYSGVEIRRRITKLFNKCLQFVNVPNEWLLTHDTSGISKLFGKILQVKIRTAIGNEISEEQSGYITGRDRTDNLFKVPQLTQRIISTNYEVH